MADVQAEVQLKFGYTNSDFTRQYNLTDIPTSALANVKTKIQAINSSLAGSTSDGLNTFFRADDYDDSDQSNIKGELKEIVEAKIITKTTTEIPLS